MMAEIIQTVRMAVMNPRSQLSTPESSEIHPEYLGHVCGTEVDTDLEQSIGSERVRQAARLADLP
jgi:hypothetical protein